MSATGATFEEIVENIARIGLKRPITVAPRAGTDPSEYDLVCGQGRLEAFIELKQNRIPAIVINADESDCLVMSLVENCARRQHNPIDLMREIGALREARLQRPPDRRQDRRHRRIREHDRRAAREGRRAPGLGRGDGTLPLNLAIEIAKTDAAGAQRALMDAYTQKKLRGRKLALVRRLIQQRELRGPQLRNNPFGRRDGAKRMLTSEGLVRAYQQEADRQKLLIKKAELTQSRLMFVREAFR